MKRSQRQCRKRRRICWPWASVHSPGYSRIRLAQLAGNAVDRASAAIAIEESASAMTPAIQGAVLYPSTGAKRMGAAEIRVTLMAVR